MSPVYDDSHIQRVLQAVNIVDIIGRYVALAPRGKESVGICPFHDDRKPSMYVNPAKQIFKCFACGAGGNAITFVMRRERMPFPEAVAFLAEQVGVELPKRSSSARGEVQRKDLVQVNRWAGTLFRRQLEDEAAGRRGREYVAQRGLSEETARRFGLGWAPAEWDFLAGRAVSGKQDRMLLEKLGLLIRRQDGSHYDRFRERLMFPVFDTFGAVIAFGGRTLGNDPAKYLNSPESSLFSKRQALYGIQCARDAIAKRGQAIVVEGYMDCLMAHQHGFDNTVATLGTALTEEHARLLGRFTDTITVIFDGDQAGQKATERAIDVLLGQRIAIRLAILPAGKDPCDYLIEQGAERFSELLDRAEGILEYKWRCMQNELNASGTATGRAAAMDRYLETLAQSLRRGAIDPVLQGFVLNDVAKLLEISADLVQQKVNGLLKRLSDRPSQTVSSERQETSTTARSRALQEVLEVLLNRPDLFEQARAELSAEDLADERLGALARRIWDYYGSGRTGGVAALLAECDDVALWDLTTDLEIRGAKRENFEATLEGTLRYFRYERDCRSGERIKQELAQAKEKYQDEDAERALLQEAVMNYRPDPIRTGRMSPQ